MIRVTSLKELAADSNGIVLGAYRRLNLLQRSTTGIPS